VNYKTVSFIQCTKLHISTSKCYQYSHNRRDTPEQNTAHSFVTYSFMRVDAQKFVAMVNRNYVMTMINLLLSELFVYTEGCLVSVTISAGLIFWVFQK
jgi:hypothetical protein